jgi:cobalt-zinc-cadmium efflux system outer membrane protein
MKRKIATITFLLSISLTTQFSVAENISAKSLEEVFERVRVNNSELKSLDLQLQGLSSMSEQAKAIPNPQLGLEIEDFSGDKDGLTETENTISISQRIELGGKRNARVEIANTNQLLNRAKIELKLSQILKEVQIAYSDVLLSEVQLSLAKEQVTFTKRILASVQEKVSFGGSLKGEQTKAEISLSLAKLDVRKLEAELVRKKLRLVAFWHGDISEIGKLSEENNFEVLTNMGNLDSYPILRVEALRVQASEKLLKSQEALSVPDLTVSGGYRRFEEENEDAFVAGVSVPLNIFNRNQGAIENASSSLEATNVEYEGKKSALSNRLESLKQIRLILIEEFKSLNQTILPDSKRALTQMRKAYQLGRVGYLDLLDSWRLYFDTRSRVADNSHLLQINQAEISSLTGEILSRLTGDNSNE